MSGNLYQNAVGETVTFGVFGVKDIEHYHITVKPTSKPKLGTTIFSDGSNYVVCAWKGTQDPNGALYPINEKPYSVGFKQVGKAEHLFILSEHGLSVQPRPKYSESDLLDDSAPDSQEYASKV